MWYDLLVLAILGYFALRGAARGLLSQLASIAAIVVCFVFSESFSAVFGPMVNLTPPLNNWVAMAGAYLVCTVIAFGLARVLDDWVARAKLESFNQHLGFLFGLAKGVVLCLVMTFFLVTLSPAARSSLSNSKAAYAAAHIMDKLHPIMPEKLQEALAKYLHISVTGESEIEQQAGSGESTLPANGVATQSGSPPSIQWDPNTPFPTATQPPGTASPFPTQTGTQSQPPLLDTQRAIEMFVSQLPTSVNNDLKNLIGWSLQNTPPEERAKAQQDLWNMVYQARPEDLRDLQTQLAQNGRQSLSSAIASWMTGFVAPRSTAPSTPTYTQPSVAQPGTNSYQPTGTYPSPVNGYQQPTTPTYSQPTQTYTPPPLVNVPQSQQDQLLAEISRAFSSIPPVQLQVQDDIRRKLNGLPPEVSLQVLSDWRRDLWYPQSPDPDPSTDAGATLEQRIVRQLQARGIPVNRLSSELQNRLEGATLR